MNRHIGLVGRVFANGTGERGSIPGHVIPKTLKMVLDTSLLNTQQYKVQIKGKIEQSREEVAPSSTPRCSSNWKGSHLVALDYSRQLYWYTWNRNTVKTKDNTDIFNSMLFWYYFLVQFTAEWLFCGVSIE